MDALWQDIRYALRTLARSPGFTAIGISVLALAIGINTALFSIVNALIFVKLPVPDAHALRFIQAIDKRDPSRPAIPVTYREYEALRQADPALAEMAASSGDAIHVLRGGEFVRLNGEAVSPNYFEVLGVPPSLGRSLSTGDDAAGAAPVAVISDWLWRSHFGASPDAVGRTLEFDLAGAKASGLIRRYTVVGVMPPRFNGLSRFARVDFWMPRTLRALDAEQAYLFERPGQPRPPWMADPIGGSFVSTFFRKPAGVSDDHLANAIAATAHRFAPEKPKDSGDWSLEVQKNRRNRLPFDRTGRIVPSRLSAGLMAAAGAVIVIALANLTGLLSARGLTRRGEMAVRTTLGAGAGRLTRQLLVESLLLAVAGGLAGLLVARLLVSGLVSMVPRLAGGVSATALVLDVPIDWRVLTFTSVTCIVAALLVAVAPVRQALSRDLLAGLSDGQTPATGRSRSRMRTLILVPQVCGALALLAVASLLVRGMITEELATTGYEAADVVMLDFTLEPTFYYRMTPEERRAAAQRRTAAQQRLAEAVQRIPGVESAAFTYAPPGGLPFAGGGPSVIDRDTFTLNPVLHGTLNASVSAGYFRTLGIPVKSGREFGAQDRANAPLVALVSEGLAWRVWGTPHAVGRHIALRFRVDDPYPIRWMEVVGVVADVSLPLTEGQRTSIVYLPIDQAGGLSASTILAKVSADPAAVLGQLKQAVLSADPKAQVSQPRLLRESLDSVLFPRRAAVAVLGLAGLTGLLLACIGVYGVASYSVAQRVREIGVRTALGAERRDILALFLREGARVVTAGTLLGAAVAFGAIRLTSAKIVELPRADIVTLSVAPALLAIAMMLATYIPARRAAAVDPMIALRRL